MEHLSFSEIFPRILLADFLRYFLTAGAAWFVFWVFFFKFWKHRVIQPKPLRANRIWQEFRYSMCTVVIFALVGFGILSLKNAGLTSIYDHIGAHGWLWFAGSIPLIILLHDAYFYWTHRLMHHPKIFRHVHLVHHRSTNPSPWAAYSFHPFEAVVQAVFFFFFVVLVPAHGLALFVFLVYMIVRNVLGHLGIEFLPAWFVRNKWLNLHTTTTHHDLHHKHVNGNYGLYFTWWDRWFGTEQERYTEVFEEVTQRPKEQKNAQADKRTTQGSTGSSLGVSALLLLPLCVHGQTVTGTWQTFRDDTGQPLSLVEIVEKNGSIEGRVAKIFLQPWEGENPICAKCPGVKKDQKVIGMEFLRGFRRNGSEWVGGSILDPASGVEYASKIWLKDSNTLLVRGYAGPLDLFYRTQTWLLHQADADDNPVTGIWKTIGDESGAVKSLVEIVEKNGALTGRILKIYLMPWEGDNPLCLRCPGEKKNARIVGMPFLWGFKKSGNKWVEGQIMDPGNGKTYQSSVWLENNNTLKVRGYWGLLYRTQTWKRSNP